LSEATLADLNVGDTVGVQGTKPAEDETPYAAIVAVLRDAEGQRGALRGKLTVRGDGTLSVEIRTVEEISLLTDENTQFFVSGVEAASVEHLSEGEMIGVQVVEREDGSLYASAVGQRDARPRARRGAVRGQINAIEGNAITLTIRRGVVSVLTDEQTRFRLPGVKDARLGDLEVGQRIGAAGHWNEDGSLQARIIGTRRGRPDTPQSEPDMP
jgi:hypothetical protein